MAKNELDDGFKEVPLDEGFEEVKETSEPEAKLDEGFSDTEAVASSQEPSVSEAAARGLGKGVTFGAQPVLAGAGSAALQALTGDFGPKKGRDLESLMAAYQEMKNSEIAKNKAAAEAHPIVSGAAEFAGSIPTALAGTAALGTGLVANAVIGGTAGAGSYLGSEEKPSGEGFATSVGTGGVIGAALPPVIGAAGKMAKSIGKAVVPKYVQEGFQAGREGVNLLSDKAIKKIVPEESFTAADKLTNKMLEARASLGKESTQVLEKAAAEGRTIDAEPAFQKLDKDFAELLAKDSSYADEASESGKLSTKLLSRMKQYENIDSLNPIEANNLRDEIYQASRNVKSKDPYLAKLGFEFADNISVMLKSQIPAYEEAAARYDQFSKLLPETILSKGEEAKLTNIKLKSLENPYLELKDATSDMLSGYARPGTSFDTSKRTLNRLEQSLSDLADYEKQRQSAAEIEGKDFQSVFDKMGMNRDEILDFIKKKSQRVAAYDLARGSSTTIPLKVSRSLGGAATDLARGGGVYVGNVGGLIYNAPNEVLQAVSEKLSLRPEVKHLGEALSNAIKSNDLVKKNAAIFAIMQNPKAKFLIDPNLKEEEKQSEPGENKPSKANTF